MFQTVFALYALQRFDLGPAETAYILTYIGIIIAVVQGGLIGRLTEHFEEKSKSSYQSWLRRRDRVSLYKGSHARD